MIEIRPIRAAEGDQFLELMCSVFGLDLHRARSIFYSEPMFDLHRKWALFEDEVMLSILTTVPLRFGWGKGFGIAGVATAQSRQSEGFAGRLLDHVLAQSQRQGEVAAYLFAQRPEVYARHGFEVIDKVIRGPMVHSREVAIPDMLDFVEVQARYAKWCLADPMRLHRDDQRWKYWQWNLRICTPLGAGYLCTEGSLVREIVHAPPLPAKIQLPPDTEWLGLESMTEHLGITLRSSATELLMMARNAPGQPAMFMTDQF